MADDQPRDADGSRERRTRAAEVIDATTEGVTRLGRLRPEQVLTVFAMISLGFICCLQAFQVYAEREDRKATNRERAESLVIQARENNAQVELMRRHCSDESRDLRSFFADQNEKRMRFEADERGKDRAALHALAVRLADVEKILGRKPPED